jgi:regulator of replication initiation timing
MEQQPQQQPTSDQVVIQTLAVENVNLKIENIRLKHELSQLQQKQGEGDRG